MRDARGQPKALSGALGCVRARLIAGIGALLFVAPGTLLRRWRPRTPGMVFVILWLASLGPASAQQRPYYFGRTTDSTPVEVTLQDKEEVVRLKIPRVYMTFSDNWKGGRQEIVELETIFPSMAPLSATRSSTSGSDVVVISVVSRAKSGGNYHVPHQVRLRESTQWTLVDETEEFLVYASKDEVESWKQQNKMLMEFLVPRQKDTYFSCLRERNNPGVGCTGHANLGQNLLVRFQFKRSELATWREIRERSLKLLESFRVKDGRQEQK